MAKKGAVVRTTVKDGILAVEVHDGDKMLGRLTYDPDTIPAGVREGAIINGLRQGIVDCAALGAESTPADKWAAIKARNDRWMETGEWSAAGEGGTPTDGFLVRALMEYKGLEREAAAALVAKMDGPLQYKMRQSDVLKPIIDRLKAAVPRKPVNIDVSAALAALMTPTPEPDPDTDTEPEPDDPTQAAE